MSLWRFMIRDMERAALVGGILGALYGLVTIWRAP